MARQRLLTLSLLLTALAWLTGPRRLLFLLLAPWAAIVSLSRPILRVHWPADILIGGFAGIVVGSAIGAVAAQRVQMTAMPQMVAIFNGFGGVASALVALLTKSEVVDVVGRDEAAQRALAQHEHQHRQRRHRHHRRRRRQHRRLAPAQSPER